MASPVTPPIDRAKCPRCDKCGSEVVSGVQFAYCPKASECELWPSGDDASKELEAYRLWEVHMTHKLADAAPYMAKVKAGTHVLMPKKATQEMAQAIENYFATRIKYRDRPNSDALKADCWQALMAYYAMVDVVIEGNEHG